jgi:large subunit ribosomal protein L15
MDVTTIPAVPGARHRRKRVGRGVGSGHGKTATRGTKGQRSRTGSGKRPGFEGGRNPLIRRIPKRGFKRKERRPTRTFAVVNLGDLNQFDAGAKITPETLAAAGLIRPDRDQVKLLGDGELTKRVSIAVHQASASAKTKLARLGGTLELIAAASRGS